MVSIRLAVFAWFLLAGNSQALDWSRAGGGLLIGQDAGAVTAGDLATEPFWTGPSPTRQPYADKVEAAAGQHGLDPKLLHALVIVESGYRPEAVSHAGATGLTQLMPGTAAELGVADPYDPDQNLSGGAAYLARQLRTFGDVRLALAAYNAGPGRVQALGRIPKIEETERYIAQVVDCYLALTAGRQVHSARQCKSPGAAS